MITMNLQDRTEYKIGDDWSCHEVLVVQCPKCGRDTIEVITYADMTLYYHEAEFNNQLVNSCTVYKGGEPIPDFLEPIIMHM